MARFIHIADLHLGRTLHQFRLIEEQAKALNEVLEFVRSAHPKVDALLLAGDIYDRALPPTEAVELFHRFLMTCIHELNTRVVVIPGNHDSAERLSFAAGLTRSTLHLARSDMQTWKPFQIHDEHGAIDIFALPFLDPPAVRAMSGQDAVRDHNSAMGVAVTHCLEQSEASRKLLVAHAFVTGCSVTDSERELYVGGSGQVSAAHFQSFDYVALGHLHRPQPVSQQAHIRYAGSLLKYSKSEADHEKSFTVIDMDADGAVTLEAIPFQTVRDLRILRGHFDALMTREDPSPEDFIFFELLDTDPISDVMAKLKTIYPRAVHLTYVERVTDTAIAYSGLEHKSLSVREHFMRFFESVTNDEMSHDHQKMLDEVIQELGETLETST